MSKEPTLADMRRLLTQQEIDEIMMARSLGVVSVDTWNLINKSYDKLKRLLKYEQRESKV